MGQSCQVPRFRTDCPLTLRSMASKWRCDTVPAAMTYPRVKALHFVIEHGPSVDYSQAEPLSLEEPSFDVVVNDRNVCFTMKAHCATESDARHAVARYIDAWEFEAGLARGPESFRLRFDVADIEDLDPSTGQTFLRPRPIRLHATTGSLEVQLQKRRYPAPPTCGLAINPDVRSMFDRYLGYRRGREHLTTMAYFCLTVLETSTGQRRDARKAASKRYGIDEQVLRRIGQLTATKGGAGARKAQGARHDLSRDETRFLDEAIKTSIRRAAETAHDPTVARRIITVQDLPRH